MYGIRSALSSRATLPVLLFAGFLLSFAIPAYGLLDLYVQLIIIYIGINIILALSLNIVNGYMGEFSVGHAGFMSIGAYVSAVLTVKVFPYDQAFLFFPAAIIAGGIAAAVLGLVVAIPSFKTRGDYLAIVTLAFSMIIKSVFDNIDYVGGARGFTGMDRLTTLPMTYFWTVLSIWVMRNFIYSKFGRGMLAIREEEIAAEMMTVDTRRVKALAFVISSFFAGIAGALLAHMLQFINPRMFDIIKSTDILIMVYLGGIGSITGSIIGATLFTVLIEVLRPLEMWRMVLMPLLLVVLMIYRPLGIMGLRELKLFIPGHDGACLRDKPDKKGIQDAS
jgi:branched-chain amino acid transport system permease protein